MPDLPYSQSDPFEDAIAYARESLAAEEGLPVEPDLFAAEESAQAPIVQQEAIQATSGDVSEFSIEETAHQDLAIEDSSESQYSDLLIEDSSESQYSELVYPTDHPIDHPTDPTMISVSMVENPVGDLTMNAPEQSEYTRLEDYIPEQTPEVQFAVDLASPTPMETLGMQAPELSRHEPLEFPEITAQDGAPLDIDAPRITETEHLEAPVAPLDLSPPDSIVSAFPDLPPFEESMREFESIAQGEAGSFEISPEELKQVNREMATKAMIEREMLFKNLNEL